MRRLKEATRPLRTTLWPLPTSTVARVLGIPEHAIRYVLRAELIPEAVRPASVNGRLFWWPASVLELAEVLALHKLAEFAGLDQDLRAEIEAEAARVVR